MFKYRYGLINLNTIQLYQPMSEIYVPLQRRPSQKTFILLCTCQSVCRSGLFRPIIWEYCFTWWSSNIIDSLVMASKWPLLISRWKVTLFSANLMLLFSWLIMRELDYLIVMLNLTTRFLCIYQYCPTEN